MWYKLFLTMFYVSLSLLIYPKFNLQDTLQINSNTYVKMKRKIIKSCSCLFSHWCWQAKYILLYPLHSLFLASGMTESISQNLTFKSFRSNIESWLTIMQRKRKYRFYEAEVDTSNFLKEVKELPKRWYQTFRTKRKMMAGFKFKF